MRETQTLERTIFTIVATFLFACALPAQNQPQLLKAEVRAITGSATYSTEGAAAKPLKVGLSLPANTTVKTASDSTVDLFLGASAGVIRIAEKSTLSLEKISKTETGADTAVDIQMNLPEGEMFFNVNKLSQASRYEIKLPNGVAGIRGTKGRCYFRPNDPNGNQKPIIVLVDGRLVFVHVPPGGGEPKAYVMSAPPAVYFSSTEGVKDAPEDLIKAVTAELERSNRANRRPDIIILPPQANTPREPFISPGIGQGVGNSGNGNGGQK
jgi:hypothetical protein